MRIIGGKLKGKKLIKLRGDQIRPTADRTREAIFNILGQWVINTVVLDLFAGTGAFGIEALSRGARAAVFVENDKYAVSVIRKNIQACQLERVTDIVQINALTYLEIEKNCEQKIDIIFLDPPYDQGIVSPVLDSLNDFRAVKHGCTIIVEHSGNEPILSANQRLQIYNQRKYGNSRVSFLTKLP